MYAPAHYREERPEILIAALRQLRFGTLVIAGKDGIEAVHLPMTVEATGQTLVLEGHLAAANPLWKAAGGAGDSLAIFQGPHAYVHPGWYETKRATGKAVPTWNYVAIHARGTLSVERDPAWLRRHVSALTEANEAGRTAPWAVADAPAAYIDALVRGIVGVRLEVRALEGVWKMNQNHPEANRLGAMAGLSAEPDPGARAVAAIMATRG